MTTRRRGSSFGHIDVGDTQGSSFSTSAGVDDYLRKRFEAADKPEGAVTRKAAVKAQAKKERYVKKANNISWEIPLAILVAIYAYYFMFAANDPTHWLQGCVRLSYRVLGTSDPVMYGKGKRDLLFVAFHVLWFTFAREFIMQVILKPIARSCGFTTRHKINRFVEQSYSILYYGISGPVGIYIMYKTDYANLWFFRTTGFYESFPHRELDAWFKAFYLLQGAFWAQQALVLVLALEARRKDFKELVFHHVVTVALIILSYRFHFTYMGLVIYITMDVSDFFLATSKVMNYLDSPLTPPFFFLFVVVWAYLRHYVNLVVLWSILTEFRTVGPFELNWVTQQYKCWISQYITFALLTALQLVNLYWFVLIIRIAYRYVVHNEQEDVRSEGEDDEEEEEEEKE